MNTESKYRCCLVHGRAVACLGLIISRRRTSVAVSRSLRHWRF